MRHPEVQKCSILPTGAQTDFSLSCRFTFLADLVSFWTRMCMECNICFVPKILLSTSRLLLFLCVKHFPGGSRVILWDWCVAPLATAGISPSRLLFTTPPPSSRPCVLLTKTCLFQDWHNLPKTSCPTPQDLHAPWAHPAVLWVIRRDAAQENIFAGIWGRWSSGRINKLRSHLCTFTSCARVWDCGNYMNVHTWYKILSYDDVSDVIKKTNHNFTHAQRLSGTHRITWT